MEAVYKDSCVYCNSDLPSRGYYCPRCKEQVRCMSCKDLLEKDALGCVMCGTPVGESREKQNSVETDSNRNSKAPNKIGFKKQGNSVSLDAELTDLASSYLADTLGQIVTNGAAFLRNQHKQSTFLGKPQTKILNIPTVNHTNDKVSLDNTVTIGEGEEEVLKRIFSYENESLKLKDPRLKHSGKLDQAVRLVLLTLYTYEVLGMSQVERNVIIEILKYSKLDDAHAKNWIAAANEVIRTENIIELSVPGREIAKAIIVEIGDPSIEIGRVVYSKSKGGKGSKKKKGTPKSNADNDLEKHTTKNNSNKLTPMSMIEKLIEEGFFSEKRKVGDIIEHCKVNKAQNYKTVDLGSPLARLIQKEQLKRSKNTSDNQYEYYTQLS